MIVWGIRMRNYGDEIKTKEKDRFQMERYAFMIIKLQVLVFYLPKFR
jgi:hypothetical protein